MEDQERHFEKLVPANSVLGGEFITLQNERNKQKQAFESSKDKMGFDTGPYRRSEIALARFLEEMIPLVTKAQATLGNGLKGLKDAEIKAQRPNKHGIMLDRRDEQTIWQRFARDRYRAILPAGRKKFKAFHPGLYHDLAKSFILFRQEMWKWRYGGQPFDGSRAMHAMLNFQMQCRLLASSND